MELIGYVLIAASIIYLAIQPKRYNLTRLFGIYVQIEISEMSEDRIEKVTSKFVSDYKQRNRIY